MYCLRADFRRRLEMHVHTCINSRFSWTLWIFLTVLNIFTHQFPVNDKATVEKRLNSHLIQILMCISMTVTNEKDKLNKSPTKKCSIATSCISPLPLSSEVSMPEKMWWSPFCLHWYGQPVIINNYNSCRPTISYLRISIIMITKDTYMIDNT